jgi:hypothetical protein
VNVAIGQSSQVRDCHRPGTIQFVTGRTGIGEIPRDTRTREVIGRAAGVHRGQVGRLATMNEGGSVGRREVPMRASPDAIRREGRLQSAIPSASSTRVSSTREWIPSLR